MKNISLIILLALLTNSLFAQQETFDLVTYTPPTGWTRFVNTADVIGYSIVNNVRDTYCQVVIYKSMNTMGNSQLDFDTDWYDLVVKSYKVTNKPEAGPSTSEAGWDVLTGVATFEFEGGQSVAMLVTMSGHGKRISVSILTNTEDYQDKMKAFLGSVNPITPAETVQSSSPVSIPQVSAANPSTSVSIIGTWTVVRSDQSAYMVNNGVAGNIRRQYTFYADGTYTNLIKTFSYFSDILLTRESGSYQVGGNTLTITPQKSVIESWKRTNETNKWGPFISSKNVPLEKVTYQFVIENGGIDNELRLILQSDAPTRRDGPFDAESKWYYKFPTHDYDFVKLPD